MNHYDWSVYRGKRVLVTGHTGFKGSWLSLWLSTLGAEVFGYSLPSFSTPNLADCLPPNVFSRTWLSDIRVTAAVWEAVQESKPDLIFHLAAQPLVLQSYATPVYTAEVNIMGTAILLDTVRRQCPECPVAVVTSDKCYENQETHTSYRENDPLGGKDVYSASKACAELLARAWRESFGLKIVTLRAGNVIGGGDYATDRLIPDYVKAILYCDPLRVRHPAAVRPWQHVLDCLAGYLAAGQWMLEGELSSGAFNIAPMPGDCLSVQTLLDKASALWHNPKGIKFAPESDEKESTLLRLSNLNAISTLVWIPKLNIDAALALTLNWYKERHQNAANNAVMGELCRRQIEEYSQ